MAIYDNCVLYITCATDTLEKIARIDTIISALEDVELDVAVNAGVEEYQYDDGQVKIRTIYRDMGSIERTIQALTRRKVKLQNTCAGYRYSLMDGNVKRY